MDKRKKKHTTPNNCLNIQNILLKKLTPFKTLNASLETTLISINSLKLQYSKSKNKPLNIPTSNQPTFWSLHKKTTTNKRNTCLQLNHVRPLHFGFSSLKLFPFPLSFNQSSEREHPSIFEKMKIKIEYSDEDLIYCYMLYFMNPLF